MKEWSSESGKYTIDETRNDSLASDVEIEEKGKKEKEKEKEKEKVKEKEIQVDDNIQTAFQNMMMNKEEYSKMRKDQNQNSNMLTRLKSESTPQHVCIDIQADENTRKILVHWADYCKNQQNLHELCREFFHRWGNILSISSIIMSAASGISTLVTSNEQTKNRAIGIIFGLVGVGSSVIMTIYRQLNFSELEKSHSFYANEYNKIKDDITVHMTINMSSQKMYASMEEYVKFCYQQITSLNDRAPSIKISISKQYDTTLKQNDKKKNRDPNIVNTWKLLNQLK